MTQNTNKDVIMQYWTWEMNEYAIDLINNGRNSIYSPCSQFYFNDPYAELPLKTTYTKPIHLKNLSNKGKANIMGVEGCIWSEWIINDELLEVLINPRLACLSEKAWTLNKNLNFKDFLLRNENFEKTLTYKNVAFADKKIALAKGKKYRDTIAKAFRSNDKLVEYKLYKKHHSINF